MEYCILTGYNPSGYGGPPGAGQFPGAQYLNDPMANMAMQYGQSLAGQGTDFVHKNVSFMTYLCLCTFIVCLILLFTKFHFKNCILIHLLLLFTSAWKICVNVSGEVLFCCRYHIRNEKAGDVVFSFHPFCK